MGLFFNNGVICEATDETPSECILSFAQIRGMILEEQWLEVAREIIRDAVGNEIDSIKVDLEQADVDAYTETHYTDFLERFYDTDAVKGSIIYQMTLADGDLAVKCIGFFQN